MPSIENSGSLLARHIRKDNEARRINLILSLLHQGMNSGQIIRVLEKDEKYLTAAENKGESSVLNVVSALSQRFGIRKILRVDDFSYLDRRGVDLIFRLGDTQIPELREIYAQVVSGKNGAVQFRREVAVWEQAEPDKVDEWLTSRRHMILIGQASPDEIREQYSLQYQQMALHFS